MLNLLNFEYATMPGVIMEKRNILSVSAYIQWEKITKLALQGAFAFTISVNDKIIREDVMLCNGVESIMHLELCGILTGLQFATENVVIVKITQQTIISAINGDLDFWKANDWTTKGGTPLKYCELWQALYEERARRQITALQLEAQETRKLQAVSKARISRYLGI
jgi:ribonuclease HI